MPSPESRPAQTQPEITQPQQRRGKERFATIATHLRGVLIRIEPGTVLPNLKRTAEILYPIAREHADRYFQVKGLQSQQGKSDQAIKALAETEEGLRGIQSVEEDFVLTVFPRDSITYDPELLKKSLGIAYSAIVHEDLVITLQVPAAFQTERGPVQEASVRQVLTQALLDLGLSEDDLKTIMEAKVTQRVDEKALEKMIASGKASLLNGTKITDTTWAITVAPLRKSPES